MSTSVQTLPVSFKTLPTLPKPDYVATPPTLQLPTTAAGQVFHSLLSGPAFRDEIAERTGLSVATVNRQATALLSTQLLRERGDLAASGSVGRPRIALEINHKRFAVIGVHIGYATTTVVLSDIRGRILDGLRTATPRGDVGESLAGISRIVREFATRSISTRGGNRSLLWAGVAIAGRVSTNTGRVDHPRLGWVDAPVGPTIGAALGLPVSVSPHVEAMAAAELITLPGSASGTTLYVYGRETVGIALIVDGKVVSPTAGPGSVAHFPTAAKNRCDCGLTGCLEAVVSEEATLALAAAAGVLPDDNPTIEALYKVAAIDSRAHKILATRARTLGQTIAVLRDLFNPERVVLGGQAFTGYPLALRDLSSAIEARSTSPSNNIVVSGYGDRVQENAATAVALSALHANPLVALAQAG